MKIVRYLKVFPVKYFLFIKYRYRNPPIPSITKSREQKNYYKLIVKVNNYILNIIFKFFTKILKIGTGCLKTL